LIKAVNEDRKKVLFKLKGLQYRDSEGYTGFLKSVSRGYIDNVVVYPSSSSSSSSSYHHPSSHP